jgi:two-component sensor histidine kinase
VEGSARPPAGGPKARNACTSRRSVYNEDNKTFEERIDRLTERHEALAQSLELLTLDVREISQTVKGLVETSAKHENLIAQILEAAAHNNEAVANLALIARVHSQRI